MATRPPLPWRPTLLYGALLAAGTALLQWLDWQHLARTEPTDIYLALVATAFLGLGLAVGLHLSRPQAPPPSGNPAAVAVLGISPRELDVLRALADGLTTKEIARALGVSPNTVKTHLARLFEKLAATTRTGAVARARTLGLLT